VIIAGNKTAEQARALGLPVRIVPSDGRTLIAVQRDDLDLTRDAGAKALAVADNRIGELDLEWDPAVLAQLRAGGLSLEGLFTPGEWQALMASTGESDPRADQVLAPGPPTIRRGDLFQLGPHRLLCGDATDRGDVTRLLGRTVPALMATDPPYGVRYAPGWRKRAYPTQRTAVGAVLHDDQALWPEAFRLFPGDVMYAWHAARMTAAVAATIEHTGFILRAQIIWTKQHFALSRREWVDLFLHECCVFPTRAHDDEVDAFSQLVAQRQQPEIIPRIRQL